MKRTDEAPGPTGVRRELGIYLNDHLAGATAGTELARRLASSAPDPQVRETVGRLAGEIAEDRAALLEVMRVLGFRIRRYKARAGWIAERAGRLKSNGHVLRRSPLSTLLELEMLRLGVEGKAAAWRTLREVAGAEDAVGPVALGELLARAERQAEVLGDLHVQAARNLRAGEPAGRGRM